MSFSSTRWPSRAPCSTSREPPGDDPDRPQAGGRPRGGHDVRPPPPHRPVVGRLLTRGPQPALLAVGSSRPARPGLRAAGPVARPRNRSRRRVRVGGRARRHVSGRADSSCDGGDRRGRRRRHRRPSGRAAAQRPRPLSSGRLDRDVGPGCLQCPGVAGLRRPRGTPSPRRGRTSPTAVLDDRHLLRATRSRRAAAARESRPRARGP